MANTCCPQGYTYAGNGKCCPDNVPGCNLNQSISAIPCPIVAQGCCPIGTIYVNPDGTYNDPSYGSGTIQNPSILSTLTGCAILVNNGYALYTEAVPIDCPCCPEGYTFSSQTGDCVNDLQGRKDAVLTIPCINCVCEDPTPVEPQECESCNESGGQHISFQYNPFIKQCTDCVPQNLDQPDNSKLNCFMPYFLTLPNTNSFKLDA